MKWLLASAGALAALTMGIAAANTTLFATRSAELQQRWQAFEQAGVPASELAPLQSRLAELQARRVGPIPYSAVSDALFGDPLDAVERQTQSVWQLQVGSSRAAAMAALGRLEMTQPSQRSAYLLARQSALDRAQTPADYRRLAASFDSEAVLAGSDAESGLATVSGGLVGGRPTDILQQMADLSAQADQARSQGLVDDPGPAALEEAARYLLLPPGQQLAQHDGLKGDLLAAGVLLRARLAGRDHSGAVLGQARDLLAQFQDAGGSPDGYPDRIAQVQVALDAAHDDAQLAAVSGLAYLRPVNGLSHLQLGDRLVAAVCCQDRRIRRRAVHARVRAGR